MKILACLALFVLLGANAYGQQASSGRVFAEASTITEKIVKGSPFSADAVNESIQLLADGNRIVRSSTNKLYRNSDGRFRREISGGSGGSLGGFYSIGPGITILDPVLGHRYLLDSHLKTARIGTLSTGGRIAGTVAVAPAGQAAIAIDKMRAELKAATPTAAVTSKDAEAYAQAAKAIADTARAYSGTVITGQNGYFFSTGAGSKHETRTEQLGTRPVEGVEAEGVRTVTTIPAGEIGNERPIEIVYERWYSKELQLVVMSKQYDPRFGEQTYRLTNITRSEPDPSLFELPTGYKVLSEPAVSYTFTTSSGGGQNLIVKKASGPGSSSGSGSSATKP